MDKELIQEYENPDYPVCVNFIERKKENAVRSEWEIRRNDAELIIVNNGELRVELSGGTIKAGAGKGIIINYGVRRRITSSEREDTAFFSVVFSPSFVLVNDKNNSLSVKYLRDYDQSIETGCIMLDDNNLRDEAAIDRINDIIAVNTAKKYGYEILTKGYMCMLWAIMLDFMSERNSSFNGMNMPSQDEIRVRSAVAYIEEFYADPITLEDIANKIHVSRNECCRCFKRVLFITPVDYLVRLRVFKAAQALYKDPMSVDTISELGFRTGFNNTSYFNKMFKRYLDCTPTAYKKMLKDDPDNAKKLYDNLCESITGL